jgi:hypothetical protein
MHGVSRRLAAQSVATVAVLVTGAVVGALGGGGTHATAAPKPKRAQPPTSAPVFIPHTKPPLVYPKHHRPKLQLRHPKHESWSKLLAPAPHGWSVIHSAHPIGVRGLSKQFAEPTPVRHDLQFDGYRRGVMRSARGSQFGVIEEIWDFRSPAGASAWFAAYVASNRPGSPKGPFDNDFVVGPRGMGFTSPKIDASGYHYASGVALEGDMVVHVRVFSTHLVGQSRLKHQLRVASRPVGRGIRGDLLAQLGPHRARKTTSVNT